MRPNRRTRSESFKGTSKASRELPMPRKVCSLFPGIASYALTLGMQEDQRRLSQNNLSLSQDSLDEYRRLYALTWSFF